MVVAILLGACAGFLGFLPLWAALLLTQRSTETGMGATAMQSLGGVTASLLILALTMFAAARFAHDYVGVFGAVELITFVLVSVVYFTRRNKVLRRRAQAEKNCKGKGQ